MSNIIKTKVHIDIIKTWTRMLNQEVLVTKFHIHSFHDITAHNQLKPIHKSAFLELPHHLVSGKPFIKRIINSAVRK
jgi:hypothetical protein